MTRLERAYERIERAIERLERLELHAADMVPSAAAPTDSMDDERLRSMLEAVRTDYTALQEIAETVRGRLDSTIERIEMILER